MKIKINKVIAVLLTLALLLFGGVIYITANTEIDKDINLHLLLGYSGSEEPSDQGRLSLGASGGILAPEQPIKKEVATLGLSMSQFGAPRGINDSINGIIPAGLTDVAIVPGTDGSAYQSYPGTVAGLANAVFALNQNGGGKDYVLYIGKDISVPLGHELTKEIPSVTASSSSASFTSLKGKVGTLVITGSSTDPITNSTVNPGVAVSHLTLTGDSFFGTNIKLRNIRHSIGSMFMLGNSVTLDGGSYFVNNSHIYGGNNTGNSTGDPTITINSTGSAAMSIYGGNKNQGQFTGNPTIIVNDTSGPISTIVGGSEQGTINGNITISINSSKGGFNNIYGGSITGNVIGNINITIKNVAGGIGSVYGGVYTGGVSNDITTNISNVSGAITNIYGGGYGSSAASPSNVGGNVSTTISNLGGSFANYYGGVNFGMVGSVTNVINGTGKFVGDGTFYGGSNEGDIGGPLPPGMAAINNDFDTSAYTAGTVSFFGANKTSGVIRGGIKNKVTAGVYDKGALRTVSGAGGPLTANTSFNTIAAFQGKTAEEAQQLFVASNKFSVYGDIYTEITKGIVSYAAGPGYTRAAGYGGYIEGNTTVEVGTEGLVTSAQGRNFTTTPSTTTKNRGNISDYDIVGGGGEVGRLNSIFIKGNTTNIMHNVIARWTYGGNFGGSTWGNTHSELHAGVVDTLEGGGFNGQQYWGDTSAHIYGGQIDWFLTGGGWNDNDIIGNSSVVVEAGTINASMGGTYGADATHTVHGNSEILVTGGDFSGTPRTGNRGFSGGATSVGKIAGNSKVTLDLRNSNEDFKLPGGTEISGGRPAGVNTYLGTDANNTIELNIFTKPNSNVLNGAIILGDGGGTTGTNTKSGKITVNIDAPDSTIGNFYATQYSNVFGGKLLRDVTFNINNVASINGLSGGNGSDNFTDAIVTASTNKVQVNFNKEAMAGDAQKTFDIGTMGVVNFTELNVNNATVKITGTGGIKNSNLATAANHNLYYNKFGNINLTNNSGLYVGSTASAMISANMLNISGKSTITSPSGTGRVVVTDISLGATDALHWVRNGGTAFTTEKGTWFGTNVGYKAITFNPTPNKATVLTPYNFTASDGGIMMLGDNEVVSNATNGHGIAIPGTRVEFRVIDAISPDIGTGTISHNVDRVLPGDTVPLNGASSVGKDVPTKDGWLVVTDSVVGGKITITPDAPSGSWIKQILITGSDGTQAEILEQATSDPYVWDIDRSDSHYVIEVIFTNVSEISGHSVVITESEAAAISNAQNIMDYQEVNGRPFLTNTITPALIAQINTPLAPGVKVRSHMVTYTAGVTGNLINRDYYIAVVPDTAVIEQPGRRGAIDASDATMMLAVAKTMTETNLNTNYTYPAVYLPDGTIATATIDSAAIATLNGMTIPGNVNVTYSYTLADPTKVISKTVVVLVLPDGKLKLDTVPKLEFGSTQVPGTLTDFWMPTATSLVVEDSRINPYGSDWEVQLKVSDLTAAGGKTIYASAIEYTNTIAGNGPTGTFPLNSVTTVWESTTNATDFQTLSWPVSSSQGFSVGLDPLTLKVGAYTGTATWSVVEGP